MGLALREYLDRMDVRLLVAGVKSIEPGDLLAQRRDGLARVDHAREYMGRPERYVNRLEPGNMIYGEIEERRKLDGKVGLPFFGGLKVSGALNKARRAVTVISEVQCRVFDDTNGAGTPNALFHDLLELRTDRRVWRRIDEKIFVYQCWYATRFRIEFTGESGLNASASVRTIQVDGNTNWTDNNVLEVVSNPTVPFGVSGWKI